MMGRFTITKLPGIDFDFYEDLDQNGKIFSEDCLDVIYMTIDDLMRNGKMDVVSQILSSVDIKSATVILLAYLSITNPLSNSLTTRMEFYDRVEKELIERRPNEYVGLLSGLK